MRLVPINRGQARGRTAGIDGDDRSRLRVVDEDDGVTAEPVHRGINQREHRLSGDGRVVPVVEQEQSLERAVWHREQADETLLKSLITDHHQWTGSLRAREILDHWNEALPKFVKVFPNEYKRALAEISLKAMTALGEIRATSEADDVIAKARTAGKTAKVTAPK